MKIPCAVALLCSLLANTACKGEAEQQRRAELARISHTIAALRDADNAARRPHLKRLEHEACTSPDACKLRQTCAAAYREHLAALEAAQVVRAALAGDAGAAELARAAVLADTAGTKLKAAKPMIDGCTALDAELTRDIRR